MRNLSVGLMILALSFTGFPQNAHALSLTIQGNEGGNTNNCIPFGCPGLFTPFMGFIYKNLPAFSVSPGDFIAFDTNSVNDVPLQFNIALAPTTVNGGATAISTV